MGIKLVWQQKDYASKLIEDHKIRTYLNARINKGGISKIVIERTLGKLIVTVHTSKPGIIIGKGGGEVDRIKEELKNLPVRKMFKSTFLKSVVRSWMQ
jgi:small subunit ribosomal protein S3